ncbi:hypothetical protein ELQ92_04815 [Labedella populi]|uniref:Hemagglutinin n=1 Tax=Labedella populi TaxID=2498850 RepID=A0A3S5CPE1_9MICO|nr:hypothetical protein [Labedella populi]RWZ68530.1 hypothetical protein ELQ92_04815 [Labedella populi]
MEARSRRIASLAVWALVLTILVPLAGLMGAAPAKALVTDGFDPGYIISDEKFADSGSMTNAQIHEFLQAKGAKCTSNCLKDYRMATSDRDPVAGRCNGYTGRSSENVANIIKNVAVSCGINPQVLLVMLEKEQGLVTATAPSASRYKIAMGYACPDTAPCDTRYYGFYNQVYMAAYQYKVYATSPSSFRYKAGQNNSIQWHPNASCGSSTVYIRNQATASLYNYTPYRPNAAALANPYGIGNSCSSYGNRNFFVKFTDWFGTTTSSLPEGRINSTVVDPGVVRVTGWALDRDSSESIGLHVYVNGSMYKAAEADISRPDVGRAFPGYGDDHGFDLFLRLPAGQTEVCVYGLNVGGGKNNLIACRTVDPIAGSPVGSLTTAQVEPGGVRLAGWALDPDTLDAASLSVTFQGKSVGTIRASSTSEGVVTSYPTHGTNRGFDTVVPVGVGRGDVCLTAVNVGVGKNVSLGCRTLDVFGDNPIGRVDTMYTGPATVQVSGWTIDRNTTGGVNTELLVDGKVVASKVAAASRPDVARVYPGYGEYHGYTVSGVLPAGSHTVCVRFINRGDGTGQTTMGCRSVTAPTGSPTLEIEKVVRTATGYTYTGYAMDPDSTSPVTIRAVTPNGTVLASTTASASRPDRGAAFPLYGADQGFTLTVPLGAKTADFCVTAVNVGAGSNAASCTRFGPDPTARLDAVTAAPGGVDVRGWALDPDTRNAIDVHVYVDGRHTSTLTANGTRADIGRAYPAYGDAHGYSARIQMSAGSHNVCVYALNVGSGTNVLVRCQKVVVSGGLPFGRVDSLVASTGGATVSGWALDYDTANPIDVHVYVDGKMRVASTASGSRPDVARVYPAWGAQRGYSVPLALSSGTHEVCVYGINAGPGKNDRIGCRTITVR